MEDSYTPTKTDEIMELVEAYADKVCQYLSGEVSWIQQEQAHKAVEEAIRKAIH